MQRVTPEDAARLHELDMEAEKASARLNMIMNVAAFVVIVGVLRVGKYKTLPWCVQCDLILHRAFCLEICNQLHVKTLFYQRQTITLVNIHLLYGVWQNVFLYCRQICILASQ